MFMQTPKCHHLPMATNKGRFIQNLQDRFAVPGLIRYVALLNALVFILHLLAPGYLSVLELDPHLILEGQIWRLITWIFIPETLSPFWIFFALLFLLYLGDGLEAGMGAPRLTLFYLTGVVLCTVVNFFFGLQGEEELSVGPILSLTSPCSLPLQPSTPTSRCSSFSSCRYASLGWLASVRFS